MNDAEAYDRLLQALLSAAPMAAIGLALLVAVLWPIGGRR